MGTEKRERQKANRALRQQQEIQADQRSRVGRIALYVGLAVVGILLLVVTVNVLSGDDGNDTVQTAEPADDAAAAEPTGTGAEAGTEADPDRAASAGDEVIPDGCPPAQGTGEQTREFDEAPPFCLDPDVTYAAQVTTNLGEFTVDLDQEQAPNTVNNFVFLARNGYFDATECHRIVEDFVVQCGDPTATGAGGPGYQIEDELPDSGEYVLGSVVMANKGQPNTGGGQFFVVTGEAGTSLDPQYSLFGQVTAGFDDTVSAMAEAGVAGEPVEILEVVVLTS